MTYVKLQIGHIVYYIRSDVFYSENTIMSNSQERLLLSDIVINKRDNSFVKCRASIEDIIDSYTKICEGAE